MACIYFITQADPPCYECEQDRHLERHHHYGPDVVKIGMTAGSAASRLVSLQTGTPWDLTVVATIPVGSAAAAGRLERALHKRFTEYRLTGEWFAWVEGSELDDLIDMAGFAGVYPEDYWLSVLTAMGEDDVVEAVSA